MLGFTVSGTGSDIMAINRVFLHLVAVAALVSSGSASSQEATASDPATNPLQPFERLVGGQWHLGDSYQEFEWGVAQKSVKARSYFIIDGEAQLVSEGVWYWHPGKNTIEGRFTAIGMPVELFDYTTRFEGDTMVSDLRAYAASGKETVFEETWTFIDDTHFEWALMSKLADGTQPAMSGTYSRVD